MAIQAGDASFARPSAADMKAAGLVALGVYTGAARPDGEYVKSLLDIGVAVWWIQETFSERSLQGFQAGVLDAQYADRRVNEIADVIGLNHNIGKIWYVFSDGNAAVPSDNDTRDAMKEYARGIESVSTRSEFGAYGNRWAVDSARLGSSHCTATWVPSSWGSNDSDVLWQMANIANPLDGVDMDWVVRDISEIGAWGIASSPTKQEEDDSDMPYVAQLKALDGRYMMMLVDGGRMLRDFGLAEAGAPYGVPKTWVDWKSKDPSRDALKRVDYETVEWDAIRNHPTTTGTVVNNGLTDDQVRIVVREELNKTKLGS